MSQAVDLRSIKFSQSPVMGLEEFSNQYTHKWGPRNTRFGVWGLIGSYNSEGTMPSLCQFSDYPLILSLENHCTWDQQHTLAQHLTEILGEQLLSTTIDGVLMDKLPSPEVGTLWPARRYYGFHSPSLWLLHSSCPLLSSQRLSCFLRYL